MQNTFSLQTVQPDQASAVVPENNRWHACWVSWRSRFARGSSPRRAIVTIMMAALAWATAPTAVKAVTFDEVHVKSLDGIAPPFDFVATDDTPSQEEAGPFFNVGFPPPGFLEGTLLFLEGPSNPNSVFTHFPGFTNESVNPPFISDALTLQLGPAGRVIGAFISDSMDLPGPVISSFPVLLFASGDFAGSFGRILEDGTLQDVSAIFGLPPRTVLVGSDIPVVSDTDVPEPSALVLLATALAGLLAYGWRRLQRG